MWDCMPVEVLYYSYIQLSLSEYYKHKTLIHTFGALCNGLATFLSPTLLYNLYVAVYTDAFIMQCSSLGSLTVMLLWRPTA